MNIIITGTTSGLGKAMAEKLGSVGHKIFELNVSGDEERWGNGYCYQCDVRNETDVIDTRDKIFDFIGYMNIDCIINNAGVNYINWLQSTPAQYWDEVMATNAKSIFLMSKAYAECLARSKGTILNITSNAAWVPMTNSICYNASKGAAHIMTLQLARELSPRGVTVFGIAPNKLEGTGMSRYIEDTVCGLRGWTPEEAAEYQLKALPAGAETPPAVLADFISYLLMRKENHRYLTGTIIPYGK